MYEKIQGLPISNAEFELLDVLYEHFPEEAVEFEKLLALVYTSDKIRKELNYISIKNIDKRRYVSLSSLLIWSNIDKVKEHVNIDKDKLADIHMALLKRSKTYKSWYTTF